MKRAVFLMSVVLLLLIFMVGCSKNALPQNATSSEVIEQTAEGTTNETVQEQPQEETTEQTAPEVPASEPVKENETVEPTAQPNTTVAVGKVYNITITNSGFTPKSLTITIGDTVAWKNARDLPGRQAYAYIIGARGACKRPVLNSKYPPGIAPGEEFSYMFNITQECVYVDGVQTTQSGTIIVK